MTKSAEHTIEVFRPGAHVTMGGERLEFSADDLRTLAASYDNAGAPAPIVIGHPGTDAPAFGWASGFRYDEQCGKLLADVGDVVPAFADAVRAKRYRKVSLAFFRPTDAANPKPGVWYPRHIGFLGGAAPAVSGLKTVSFGAGDPVTVEFAAGVRESAGLFRRLRDFLIEKFSLEDADRVLPDYELRWLDDIARQSDEPSSQPSPVYAAPTPEDTSMTQTTPASSAPAQQPVDFAAREQQIVERERQLAQRELAAVHDSNVAFAAGLVGGGRILAAHQGRMVAILDAMSGPAPGAAVAFAAGEPAISPVDHLKKLLGELPQAVPLGGILPEPAQDNAPAFAAPDRGTVDTDRLAVHNRALAWQAAHPGTDYMAAVRAVAPNA